MAFITLDYETFYGTGYSLKTLTYEAYLRDPQFKIHLLGLKINDATSEWVHGPQIEELLHDTFTAGNDHTLIAHNTLFDGTILSWLYGLRAARYWCTQAMSRALWNQQKHDLGSLAKRLWPNDPTKRKGDELKDTFNIRELTGDLLQQTGKYCVNDVDLCFDGAREMYQWIPADELEIMYMTLQMFIHPDFVLNRELVRAHLDNLQEEQHHIIAEARVPRSTLSSTTKLAKYIKDKFDLDVPRIPSPTVKNPDNMKYAFAKNELACLDFYRDNPQVQQILDARFNVASTQEQSRSNRFLDHSLPVGHKPDGVIAIPLHYAKAHTLRFGGANKVNGQNLGKKSPLRASLQSPENYMMVVVDQANIEARMLAWAARETSLLQMFANKADIYSAYATKIYGRPVNRKRVELDAHGKEFKPDYIEGHVGKTCVLGLGYQMGPSKFRNTLAQGALGGPPVYFSLEKCHDIVHNVFRFENPNIVRLWGEAQNMIALMLTLKPGESYAWNFLTVEHKRIRLPSGLYLNYPGLRTVEEEGSNRVSYEYWQGEYYTNLYGGKLTENIIQAIARIVMTTQMLDIHRELKKRGDKSRVILTVHDEVVAFAKTELAEETYLMMLDKMRITPPWCSDGSLVLDAEGDWNAHYSK